ncbi:MAG TPA: hypothetical protein VJG30_02675 [Candidatus Nanoarchaeia archaeon]|nr:hypothetical protein [Candidatus Nanoarchaeia archaeon]
MKVDDRLEELRKFGIELRTDISRSARKKTNLVFARYDDGSLEFRSEMFKKNTYKNDGLMKKILEAQGIPTRGMAGINTEIHRIKTDDSREYYFEYPARFYFNIRCKDRYL